MHDKNSIFDSDDANEHVNILSFLVETLVVIAYILFIWPQRGSCGLITLVVLIFLVQCQQRKNTFMNY